MSVNREVSSTPLSGTRSPALAGSLQQRTHMFLWFQPEPRWGRPVEQRPPPRSPDRSSGSACSAGPAGGGRPRSVRCMFSLWPAEFLDLKICYVLAELKAPGAVKDCYLLVVGLHGHQFFLQAVDLHAQVGLACCQFSHQHLEPGDVGLHWLTHRQLVLEPAQRFVSGYLKEGVKLLSSSWASWSADSSKYLKALF